MGLELKHLAVQSSLEARSKSFCRMLADLQIPVSPEVIFTREPKIAVDGFRWAPASLATLTRNNSRSYTHPFLAEDIRGKYFDTTGLYCKYLCYRLRVVKMETINRNCIATTFEKTIEFWHTYPPDSEVKPQAACGPSNDLEPQNSSVQLAIVLNRPVDYDPNNDDNSGRAGALVQINREGRLDNSKVLYARYLTPLWKSKRDAEVECLVEVTYLHPLNWCIG
jgi:hypothetical protein